MSIVTDYEAPARGCLVRSTIEVPARLQAFRTAAVRARVDGIVRRRLYKEGTEAGARQRNELNNRETFTA